MVSSVYPGVADLVTRMGKSDQSRYLGNCLELRGFLKFSLCRIAELHEMGSSCVGCFQYALLSLFWIMFAVLFPRDLRINMRSNQSPIVHRKVIYLRIL